MDLSLKVRALRAGGWTLASYFVSSVIRFGSNLVLTRLLAPEMFGVMTIATIILIGLAMFSDLGLRQNIVQSARGDDPTFLNTAWTIQVIRGLLLWLCAAATGVSIFVANWAGLVSADSVYANPSLPAVIGAVALTTLIGGFESTKMLQASRKLALGRITVIEIVAQIAGLLGMLAWAIADRSIWVLVIGVLVSSLVRTLSSHLLLPGISNRLLWNQAASHELISYGKWIFLSSVLGFLVNSGDRLLLGALVSSTVLGLYFIGSLIPISLETILSKLISEVTFPALSEIVRDRPHDLKQIYYRFFQIVAPLSYALTGFLLASGKIIILLLYDVRYQEAGWMLQLQSLMLLAIPTRLGVQSYLAIGAPKLVSHIALARLVILYPAIPLGFEVFGVEGAIGAIAIAQFVPIPMIYFYNIRHGVFDLYQEVRALLFIVPGLIIGKAFEFAALALRAG